MRRAHDRGGWPDQGPIPRTEHALAPWEKETDAVFRLLETPARGLLTTDELRRGIESLEPEAYEAMAYYERWAFALESLLVEKGVLTHEEVDPRVRESEASG